MKTNAQKPKAPKTARTLDDDIAALQERLARLQAQKREKERKELERNQKAIVAFLLAEKFNTVPIEEWTAAAPALRKLLKVRASKGAAQDAPSTASGSQRTTHLAKAAPDVVADPSAEPENAVAPVPAG